ncbi:MAG: hypothetical protein U1F83_12990 [Verrucomicrobiota bacterium]
MKSISCDLFLICAVLTVTGCSTHSWWIVADSVSTQTAPGRFAAHTGKVFLTDLPLPVSVKYESLGKIDGGKVTFSNTEDLLILMANRSRMVGANAVINLKTWRQPSGWSWNAIHGSGEAIRISDTNSLVGLAGYWY